jgi:thymidylate synthase (FAD)
LLDTFGTDATVCDAARVSYGDGTKKVSDDRNLIRYLLRHKHTSPFEQCEVRFLLSVPIFVMRQLVRHRTANLNECSARYSVLPDTPFEVFPAQWRTQSTTNKQGSSGLNLHPELGKQLSDKVSQHNKQTSELYNLLLEQDVARELARTILPVSYYTQCYWKIDLHNFFHFSKLRMDGHAQKEIRDFANPMYGLVAAKYPLSTEAFEDYSLNSYSLSSMEINLVRDIAGGKKIDRHDSHQAIGYGMSEREWKEFWNNLLPIVGC